jgi:hypothetical protein
MEGRPSVPKESNPTMSNSVGDATGGTICHLEAEDEAIKDEAIAGGRCPFMLVG